MRGDAKRRASARVFVVAQLIETTTTFTLRARRFALSVNGPLDGSMPCKIFQLHSQDGATEICGLRIILTLGQLYPSIYT